MRWKVVANRLYQRGLPYPFLTCRIVTMKWYVVLAALAIIDPCMDHMVMTSRRNSTLGLALNFLLSCEC